MAPSSVTGSVEISRRAPPPAPPMLVSAGTWRRGLANVVVGQPTRIRAALRSASPTVTGACTTLRGGPAQSRALPLSAQESHPVEVDL
jgi:hypothetical protein